MFNDDVNIDYNGNFREIEIMLFFDVIVFFEKYWLVLFLSDIMLCWIYGMMVLVDGCVLILDLNNNVLKLFDEN